MGKSITNTLRDLVGDVADDLKEAFDEILEHDKHRRGPRHPDWDRDRHWDPDDRWDRDRDWHGRRRRGRHGDPCDRWDRDHDRDRHRDHDHDHDHDRDRPIDDLMERMDSLIRLLRERSRGGDAPREEARGTAPTR